MERREGGASSGTTDVAVAAAHLKTSFICLAKESVTSIFTSIRPPMENNGTARRRCQVAARPMFAVAAATFKDKLYLFAKGIGDRASTSIRLQTEVIGVVLAWCRRVAQQILPWERQFGTGTAYCIYLPRASVIRAFMSIQQMMANNGIIPEVWADRQLPAWQHLVSARTFTFFAKSLNHRICLSILEGIG